MKKFNISPLESVGKIKFGMSRNEVRKILGEYSEYKDKPKDKITVDCFDVCQVFYNKDNCVEFIMFHELCEVELKWENKILTKMTKDELISYFSEIDKEINLEKDAEDDIVSFESNNFGIACFFEKDIIFDDDDNEEEVDKVETISFAVKNYWK